VAEYREPTFEYPEPVVGHPVPGVLAPTNQVGQFRLVVKCEFPRKVLLVLFEAEPHCTGSPRMYMARLESLSVAPLI